LAQSRHAEPVAATDLTRDVVIILTAERESTESALQETLDEIREQASLSQLGQSAAVSWTKENPYW
jgi:hypothetical protein